MSNSHLYPINNSKRRLIDLCGMWKFKIDFDNNGREKNFHKGLTDTTEIPVPSSYNDLFVDKKIREHFGDVWYETEFYIPEEYKNMNINIRFGCATHKAVVYVNGEEVGSHIGGFTPFRVNINKVANFGLKNKLIVAVNNELSNQTLPCGHTATKHDGKKFNMPSFDFFNYAGLNRPVKLEATALEYINDIDIITDIDGKNGIIDYKVDTTGENDVYITIYDENQSIVATSKGKNGKIIIENANLWQPRAAYLYNFTAEIKNGEQLIDEYSLNFGIRTVKVEGSKILINGKPVYLKGFGKHEDSEIAGRGYNPPVIKRDFELINRDKNHPCVIMWSLFNEPEANSDLAYPYFKDIFEYARKIDKQNLPKTFAAHRQTTTDKRNFLDLCDILTLNRYYGWYDFGGYDIDDANKILSDEMKKFEQLQKPIVFTEFGADTMPGIHKLPSVMWSEEYQIEYMKMQFSVFDSYNFIVGEQLWNFADFQTIESTIRADGNKKGIFTRNRQPKMSAHFIRDRWTKLPLNYKN